MIGQNLKHGGCEGEEKIEYFKLLVTHSTHNKPVQKWSLDVLF